MDLKGTGEERIAYPLSNQYLRVAQIVKSCLGVSDSLKFSDEIIGLRSKIASYDTNINYDQFAEEFAQLYWLRNFWKAVYFFEYEYALKPPILDQAYHQDSFPEIIVLGAGSAADTIACLTWLNQKIPLANNIPITLIDRSQRQLDLAKKLIEKVRMVLDKVNFSVTYEKMDARAWNPSPNCADLILMSHFLTENPQELNILLEKVKYAIRKRGDIVVIEREKDPVWGESLGLLADLGISVYDTDLNKEKLSRLCRTISPEGIERDATPHYVKASLPDWKYQVDLVTKYFQAWRRQSLDLINQIFLKEAIFDEKPGIEETIRGLPGMLEYWKANPLTQKNINVYIRNVAYGGNCIVCAFEGDFDTPIEHVVIRGAMNFYVDFYTQKINRLTEYFGTEKTSLE